MLMSDGPYEGNIEGAKRQVENIEKIMAENEKRRNENSSALPSERNRDLRFFSDFYSDRKTDFAHAKADVSKAAWEI